MKARCRYCGKRVSLVRLLLSGGLEDYVCSECEKENEDED